MSISAIITMMICLSSIIGGFIFFLSSAINKDKNNSETKMTENDNQL